MSQASVRVALESRLSTWAAARVPALPIAWENVPYDPAQDATWLAAFVLPADTTADDLEGALRTFRGVMQVNVATPINVGPGAAAGIVDELETLFPVNGRYTAGGVTVQVITPPSAGPAQQDATHYVVPVSFQYRADT